MNTAKIFFSMIMCILMAGCASTKHSGGSSDIMNFNRDEVWVLATINQKEIVYQDEQEPITIMFNPEAGSFSGNAGCNSFFGTYIYTPTSDLQGKLALNNVGATQMNCPDPIMKLEGQFLPMLNKTTNCTITAYRLSFYQGTRLLLEFEKL